MFNVCYNCGEYRVDKKVDPAGPFAICPLCEHAHPFRYLPLLFVCGASGTGKSTICAELTGKLDEVIMLDSDILWRHEFNTPEDNYRDFFETWLRMAKNIGQAGRPVVLFGAGCNPSNAEPCEERRYFSKTSYLALTCKDDVLAARLKARPGWRASGNDEFIAGNVKYNQALRTEPQIDTQVDTTKLSLAQSSEAVAKWVRRNLAEHNRLN